MEEGEEEEEAGGEEGPGVTRNLSGVLADLLAGLGTTSSLRFLRLLTGGLCGW